jgi:hypothetical protein
MLSRRVGNFLPLSLGQGGGSGGEGRSLAKVNTPWPGVRVDPAEGEVACPKR